MPKAIGGGAAKVRNNHHAVKRCDHRDIDPAQLIVAVDYGRRREAGGTIDGSLDEQRKTKIQVSVICSQDDFVGVRRENREKVDFILVSGIAQIGRGFDVETGHHHVADKEQRAEPERGLSKNRLCDHAHIDRRGGRKCDLIGISEVAPLYQSATPLSRGGVRLVTVVLKAITWRYSRKGLSWPLTRVSMTMHV